ncbi:MAG: ABC transporter permease [Deltaproteobacteria bacterium]|nr:ABC transporter permease [Deltaproteobacteria bacterium]
MNVAETTTIGKSDPSSATGVTMNEGETLPFVAYTPESALRNPAKLVRELFAELWKSRELIWILFLRDLKAMYRLSYLGYAWIFVPPLATSAVWLFLNSQRIVQIAETPIPYSAFVLIGTMLWTTFSTALTQPLVSFTAGKPVFTKLKVPPDVFVIAGMARVVFDLFVRLLLLLPLFIFLEMLPPPTAFLFPLNVVCLLLLASALGMVLIPLGALYQDVGRAVTMSVGFVMYLAPVIYPPAKSGWSSTLINWNPVTPIIMTGRDWLTVGHSDYFGPMLIVGGASLVVLFIAAVVLRVAMPHLVARMEN